MFSLQTPLQHVSVGGGGVLACAHFGDLALGSHARRFGAREDAANAPSLVIEYSRPLPPTPRINLPEVVTNGFRFRFTAAATFIYTVERKTSLSTATWIAVTNIPASDMPRTISVTDPRLTAAQFYRIVVR